ncbi:MAG: magnesium transporter [Nitrospiraceae bacterium]|uniref:magnesium transporter n=1 Tax=Nitrospira cf. moscoviensis SBR1015 TaxID=96242 RepID=UPI000A0E163B|nr:magnesium transporter [Nitrospira cf. moscoviensis SBR1015]MBY0249549.1 magnesium transporter [Nitrospiraceae bacterium]OQW32194.1 MAG: magnesium transporter [Nitrospira sp. SG-bin2]
MVLQSVQRLLRRGAITNLAKMLGRMHPADVAKVINHLSSSKEKREVFELVRGENKRGQVLSELEGQSIQEVLADLLHSDVAWLLKDLGPDDVAYILGFLPEERGKDILALMKTEDSTEVADILKYPKDTAGGIMTTEFFSLSEDATAQEAIRRLQHATDAEMVFYIYVTDKDERLVGVLSLRQLLTVLPATPLKNIMTRDVMSVTVDMDQEEVARQVASYNLLAIPVVEKDGRLAGIITVDDVVDVIREEATEDMLKMAGAIEEDTVSKSSSLGSARLRLPWLFTNLVGSLLSGAILWYFRYTIQEVVAIVSFIPVIAAMGGNVGLQSSTLIIRGLATGLVELTDVWTVFFREVKIGLVMGLACGFILTIVGWGLHQGFLGVVVGVSLVIAFLVSTSMATIMPIVLKRMGVDPAVAAGPFVTTANDITGITIYLTLATIFLDQLR